MDGLDDLIKEARKRFEYAAGAEQDNRASALEDLRFCNGEQWPENIKNQRAEEGRPCLTINRLPQFVKHVINSQRQNRPAIKVKPVDDKSDPALAKVYEGLIRNIEQQSKADMAYDTALEFGVKGGFGYFRIITEYSSDDVFEQDIRIKRIANPFTVYLDPDHQDPDASDMGWCFVTEMMDKDVFESRYPDADTSEFDSGLGDDKAWFTEDKVRVAEYWRKVPTKKLIGLLPDGTVTEVDKLPVDIQPIKTREVSCDKIEWYLITGKEVLETREWAGKYIPIIPVFGDETNIEGKKIYSGLVRWAKDPQRMYNYWRTQATELVALAPKAPFLATPEQIEGFEDIWKTANTKTHAYLPYNNTGAPLPQRQPFANSPIGAVNEALAASDDIKATTGIHNPSLGMESNETSGKAIIARQRQGDNATFNYIDNLSRAINHAGRILVDLIPKIYDTPRIVRLMNDDREEIIEINKVVAGPDGSEVRVNDLSVGKYDVVVSVGPAYATRRQEAAESMLQFIQASPNAAPLIADIIAKNMDWPGAEEIAERLQKALPPHIAGQGPPPEIMEQLQGQEAELQKEKERLAQEAEQHQLMQQQIQEKLNSVIERERGLEDIKREIATAANELDAERKIMQADYKRMVAELRAKTLEGQNGVQLTT